MIRGRVSGFAVDEKGLWIRISAEVEGKPQVVEFDFSEILRLKDVGLGGSVDLKWTGTGGTLP